ncbi:TauD/TfdA family dioxygenase [Streptomyces actinomycinicus]|uniref:TauD/TfdA family dioxygenase n=1 Tax=Streptomyces actinomycinicus TaxID=1695166 RepID=A0A937JQ19_9ACTN|nr:TauD/TfdA family dioxygenase [Streptomyces actinomycinicus]MBL1084956.1 TauD/TfdA family dioxygenase [Streptomyces actinomycinicus]
MTSTAEVRPYGAATGKLVLAGASDSLGTLDPAWVTGLLADAGFLLFRGFRTDLEEFSAFVKAHSSRITLDPARSFHGGEVAQKVDAGTAAVGLHLENGNSPFGPDLTWFFCEKAASAGSQTTVCDGYRVWDASSLRARSVFGGSPITYSRRVEEPKWKAFVAHQLEGRKEPADIAFADIEALVGTDPHTRLTLEEDGAIRYAYTTGAAHGTLFGARLAWANSIFGPSYNYETPRITLQDGEEIPADLRAELKALTDELTEDIDWQDGDVALIDNTRVMHGRREILDTDRTIYNAQSYIRRELVDAVTAGGEDR